MKVRRRFETRGHRDEPHVLAADDPALLEMRTIYPNTVRSANPGERVLKSGVNSQKLGDRIIKGAWAGSPLFSLKLEERKTCPATCQQLARCYGNNIGRRATRWNVDAKLYTRLNVELDELSYYHRSYVIRLHDLGDFASVEYVEFWLAALKAHSGLKVFGYTHWDRATEIGSAIEEESARGDRFRIRFSDNHTGPRTTHVIPDNGEQGRHPLGIVCPADHIRPQVTCGSCALCINSTVPIVLKAH
jgi:hypothetical protein